MKKNNKTRNFGTMTEAAFWGWIRSALRNKTMHWKPVSEAKKRARRPNQSENKRLKWQYQCNCCKKWFAEKETQVDHIVEAGKFSKETAGEFIEKLFCEVDGLQVLCKPCHKLKTNLKK